MTHLVERSVVTDAIVEALETLGFPVGDNTTPDASYGWQGEPNAASTNFIPWISVTPMPGNGVAQDLASLGSRGEWLLSYSIYVAGVTRSQSEKMADRARNKLANTFKVECTGEVANWRIQGIACTNIGSNNRVGEAIPYHFTQTDSFQVYVTEG